MLHSDCVAHLWKENLRFWLLRSIVGLLKKCSIINRMLEDKNLQSLYPMFPYPNIAQVPVEPVSASGVFPVRSRYNSCSLVTRTRFTRYTFITSGGGYSKTVGYKRTLN